jgi:hypothetical protein
MPFDFKSIRLVTKSTPPPYSKIQPMSYCHPDTSLLRSLTYIQKQHQTSEYLQGYLVGLWGIIQPLQSLSYVGLSHPINLACDQYIIKCSFKSPTQTILNRHRWGPQHSSLAEETPTMMFPTCDDDLINESEQDLI